MLWLHSRGAHPLSAHRPSWTPTYSMLVETPELYAPSTDGVEGGLMNLIRARGLYIHILGDDRSYGTHQTSDPQYICNASSAGCIRLFNQHIIQLAKCTDSIAQVVRLS